jgi:hypothetical protein
MTSNYKFFRLAPLLLIFLAIFFQACEENSDELPMNSFTQPQPVLSVLDIFKNSILENFSSSNVLTLKNVLPEHVGLPLMEAMVSFQSAKGVLVAFLPLITDASIHTEAVMIVTDFGEKRNYTLIERGKLLQIDYSKSGFSIVPLTYANIFVSFDRALFNSESDNTAEIIGNQRNDGKKRIFHVDKNDNEDIKRDWVESSQCYFFFAGTEADPYFHSYQCYTEMSWESTPGESIMFDAGGSGGGGGTNNYRNCSSSVSCFPLVKYPEGSDYSTKYPKLTEYLKNQLPRIGDIDRLVGNLSYLTNMTRSEVKRQLKWGEGPIIKVAQLEDSPFNLGGDAYGLFNKNNPNELVLDIDIVNKLELSLWGTEDADVLSFFIGVIILHEFTHYGDFNFHNDYYKGNSNSPEEGYAFEQYSYGQQVNNYRDAKNVLLKKGK